MIPGNSCKYSVYRRTERGYLMAKRPSKSPKSSGKKGFKKFSETTGKAKMEFEGQTSEIQYKSKNSLNEACTIGCAEIDIDGVIDFVLISKTPSGDVLTVTGDDPGRAPFQIEGYHAFVCVPRQTPLEQCIEEHIKAFDGQEPVADKDWLMEQTPVLPQKALDAIVTVMKIAMGAMEGMMQEVGGAIQQGFEAIADSFNAGADVEKDEPETEEEPVTDEEPETKRKVCPACGYAGRDDDKECMACGKKFD